MPTARIVRGDLAGLDALKTDALALSFFKAIKQPQGVAGFVDWRLCGRLGRLLAKAKFSGALGETMLLASLGRIGAERIFLFGLGEPRNLSDVEIAVNALKMVTVLADARAQKVALAGPPAFLGHWLEIAKNARHPFEEVVLLDADQSLSANVKQLSDSAKRGGFTFVS
jgi:hypothetical protein